MKIKIPKSKPRNPFVPLTKVRPGAGKHRDKKKEDRNTHKED